MTAGPESTAVRVELADTQASLGEISGFWATHAAHPAASLTAFLTQLEHDPRVVGPCVLVARRRGVLCGLYAARIERKRLQYKIGHVTVARPIGRVLALLERGMIGDSEPEIVRSYFSAVASVLASGRADFAHFACIPADHELRALHTSLRRTQRDRKARLEQRWILDVPSSFDDFLAARSGGTRQNIRRTERRIRERLPDLRIEARHRRHDCADLFDDVMAVVRNTYQFKLGVTPLREPAAPALWSALSRQHALSVVVAYVNGAPVAFSHAEVNGGVAVYITPGYLPEYRQHDIGSFCLVHLIRQLVADPEITSLDYGLGFSEYKRQLGSRATDEGHLRMFAGTARGQGLRILRTGTDRTAELLESATRAIGLKAALKRLSRSR